MALKAVTVSDVPPLPEILPSSATPTAASVDFPTTLPNFTLIGHRGHGMNPVTTAFRENSLASFNAAAAFPISYVEFDVQVTADGCPVIFHDIFILSAGADGGAVSEKRVTELTLPEFLAHNHTTLFRKTHDGETLRWVVQSNDDDGSGGGSLCTLQDAFLKVNPSLGFNIELKFDDDIVYHRNHLSSILSHILHVVAGYAKQRPVIFSTFHPDAAVLVRNLQSQYPVYFLTDGRSEMYDDPRRNSLEAAVKLCLENDLQGIVSEVKAVLRNPAMVREIKNNSKLSLLSYGGLNNVGEVVYLQSLMGVDGVIVDLVGEITEAWREQRGKKPQFSEKQVSFLLKLIPELIQM